MYFCHGLRFPLWPLGPLVGLKFIALILAILGIVFSIIMLIDCLKRKPADFASPITHNGTNDKIVWAVAIIASFWFYFLGAIIYYFVVKKQHPQQGQ